VDGLRVQDVVIKVRDGRLECCGGDLADTEAWLHRVHDAESVVWRTILLIGHAANGRPERRDDGRERRPRGDGPYRGEGRGRGRGGRGRGDRPPRDDRHSHTGIGEQQKQAAQGWGGESGNAEWADEKAGDAIANAEAKNDPNAAADTDARDPAFTTGPDGETGADAAEEEDKTKSYEQYLAEQKEKRAALGAGIEIRKPNEGSKQKFPEGKAFARDPAAEDFMAGAGGKTRKAKDAGPKKEQIVVDGQYYAAADSGDRGSRGGRGGSRGGSRGGRGEFRGDRGGRGRGRGGDFRGGARGGADRGPAAPRGSGFNATDESAFPALGGN